MLRSTYLWLVVASALVLTSGRTYDGFKIFEITPATREQCDLLHELSKHEEYYDFFALSQLPKNPARVMVHPNEETNFLEYLEIHGMSHKVVNENVGGTIKREFEASRLLRKSAPLTGRLSTERYYSHQEINNYIEHLAVQHPKRVFVKQVGKSFEGRIMKTVTITNGDGRSNKNVIFVDGGFHAREWISPAAVLFIIDQLLENYTANADLLLDYDWVIMPVVNPDGYEYTQTSVVNRFWRKTRQPHNSSGRICYGTDPNRNFDFHWNEEGASKDPCHETFAGPTAFSEPETIVMRDLLHTLKGRGKMYLTIHSFGNYLLYPWGWTEELPDTWEDLDEVARAGGDAIRDATGSTVVYEVGSSTNVLYIAAGGSDDYAFNAGFPISITMELSGGGETGFDPPASSIDTFVKETWIGIHAMAKKVTIKYPLQQAGSS